MTAAALYARVSTERQAGDDRVSLATQRAEYLRYCEAQGYEPSGREYVDVMSGVRDDRPEYQAMLADALSGQFQRIIALDPTRFGRDEDRAVYDMLGVKLQTGGAVTVEFIRGRHRSLSDVVEDLEDGAKERRRLSARVTSNLITVRRDRGRILGVPPYGYVKESGKLVVDETQAAVVREMFRRYLDGEGSPTIARDLNRRGVTAQQGGRWGAPNITRLFRRRVYVGESEWHSTDVNGDPVSGVIPCPPIVSVEDFDAVQSLLGRRSEMYSPRSVGSGYLLGGIVVCGLCGGRLSGFAGPRRSRRYICQGRNNTCAPSWGLMTEPLEAAVLGQLSRRLSSAQIVEEDFTAQSEEAQRALDAATRQHRAAQARLGRVLDLYADGGLSREQWAVQRERLEGGVQATQRAKDVAEAEYHRLRARADQAETVARRIVSFVGEVDTITVQAAKVRLQSVVKRVVVYGRTGRIEVELL